MTIPMLGDAPRVTSTDLRAEFLSGMRAMAPLLVGITPFGLLLGATVAASADPVAAWSGALPIYGGSAHLAVLGSLGHGGGVLVAVAAGVLVNLRVIVYMYMREPEADPAPIDRSPVTRLALALSIAGVILLGLFPDPIIGFLRDSAASLL